MFRKFTDEFVYIVNLSLLITDFKLTTIFIKFDPNNWKMY